jgi:hypothetical protein
MAAAETRSTTIVKETTMKRSLFILATAAAFLAVSAASWAADDTVKPMRPGEQR